MEKKKKKRKRNLLTAADYILPDQLLLSYHLHPHHQPTSSSQASSPSCGDSRKATKKKRHPLRFNNLAKTAVKKTAKRQKENAKRFIGSPETSTNLLILVLPRPVLVSFFSFSFFHSLLYSINSFKYSNLVTHIRKMGKKKRGHPDLEELLARPWCYYCERDFDDLKILISHQKAKHFKCERCGRRLNTAGESLSQVDNALQNRSSLDIEIFGMEGVPEDVLQAHNQRVLQQYQQAEAERRAATGNPAPGTSGSSGQSKKPKFESPSELKKRLAEHKARLAEQAAGGSSGDTTPIGAGQQSQSTPGGTPYPQQPGFVPPTGPQSYPMHQYPPSTNMSTSPYPQAGVPPIVSPVGASPTLPYHHQQHHQAMRTHTPPQAISPSYPTRTPSLPPAPGLPQRPSFGAPQVNAFQMQQLHQGQVSGPPAVPMPTDAQGNRAHPLPDANSESLSASADKLISEAAKQAKELPAKPSPAPGTPEEGAAGKPLKKEKAKSTRLVYSDNEISPEEKLARLPRYAFVPQQIDENSSGETAAEPVAGAEEVVNLPA
ncbi:uncharacterized protein ARB_01297 [Trichophyton benhamiae CBS 112371]|uniref:C2H2-type domain-containing protein n=1 Tax=Arthroderma benhamiae (strain ATCC MYA-4681 / CBS 112371) TaxID=663331 RepID=D4AYM8_ARTBC|nr:uncharacterized protein ARB_01297 [Trichophyton benhamiae CBS 112371]EFE31698.1 hypothetical protein ARB_01297 [Trichophyton benhamiae CBS 112371]